MRAAPALRQHVGRVGRRRGGGEGPGPRRGGRMGLRATTSPRRTRRPSTCWCSGARSRSETVLEVAGAPRADEAAWDPLGVDAVRRLRAPPLGCACSRTSRWSTDDGAAPDPRPFDVCGALPTGMTLLQASAGTGKTFTIAALTTSYVAEGVLPIDRLLVITFTRMATGELRERVRERLVRAFDGLADIARRPGRPRGRRARAAAGAAGRPTRWRPGATGWARPSPTSTPPPSRRRTGSACRSSTASGRRGTSTAKSPWSRTSAISWRRWSTTSSSAGSRTSPMRSTSIATRPWRSPRPCSATPTPTSCRPCRRRTTCRPSGAVSPRRCARRWRTARQARKILTYDDVLSRLRTTLLDEDRGPAACARLRERYDVVLVDEFQDTDPVQWDIMRRAFGEGGATLVLIGDPKQAIYAFRGADVHAYLQARDVVQSEWTLDVNWRSDQGLLEAYDALFGDAQLGYAGIAYRKVRAADANQQQRLVGRQVDVPLRVRIVHGDDGLVALTREAATAQGPGRPSLHRAGPRGRGRAAAVGRPRVITRSRPASRSDGRRCTPAHLPCWCGRTAQAVTVRDALRAAGVPAVIGGSGSRLRHRAGARVAAPARGARAPDGAGPAPRWRRSPASWAGRRRGGHGGRGAVGGPALVAAPVGGAAARAGRRLALPDGQQLARGARAGAGAAVGRAVHDRPAPHRASCCTRPASPRASGPTAMATWLGRRIHDAARDGENEERARRLESDAEAVQVITIHRSKGLEFPIVFCPYMWDGRPFGNDRRATCRCSTTPPTATGAPSTSDSRGTSFAQHQKMELEEARGEDLRLLYVALTRARHQAVLWWAGAQDSQHSPAGPAAVRPRRPRGRGTLRRQDPDRRRRSSRPWPALGPCVSVERVGAPSGGALGGGRRDRPRSWRRRSSTGRSTSAGGARRTRASPAACTTSPLSAASRSSR